MPERELKGYSVRGLFKEGQMDKQELKELAIKELKEELQKQAVKELKMLFIQRKKAEQVLKGIDAEIEKYLSNLDEFSVFNLAGATNVAPSGE